ncbi:MAG: nitronate monooxygenase, partial [Candidatus Aminicenantes bacterium]|nr:nitronate monooxygenase [Candidatus Aminicenantes bacterium]
NVTDIVEIAKSAEEAGSDAISLVNTFLAMAIDIETQKTKIANVFGGLSGPAIKPLAVRMVFQAASVVNIPVLGMGGITTGGDAVEFMLAGASAVQVGTANFIDPDATIQIIREIETYCKNQNIDRVEEIIGKVQI